MAQIVVDVRIRYIRLCSLCVLVSHICTYCIVRVDSVMNIAVLGAQWGDEGKGKIVDLQTNKRCGAPVRVVFQ